MNPTAIVYSCLSLFIIESGERRSLRQSDKRCRFCVLAIGMGHIPCDDMKIRSLSQGVLGFVTHMRRLAQVLSPTVMSRLHDKGQEGLLIIDQATWAAWAASAEIQMGLVHAELISAAVSGQYYMLADSGSNQVDEHWPYHLCVTNQMCYTMTQTCCLRGCPFLHEYHGKLLTGEMLHRRFVQARRCIQRLVAGQPFDMLAYFDSNIAPGIRGPQEPWEHVYSSDFVAAIIEDAQYLGMQERVTFLEDWKALLFPRGGVWAVPPEFALPTLQSCLQNALHALTTAVHQTLKMSEFFASAQRAVGSNRLRMNSRGRRPLNYPAAGHEMSAGRWLANAHLGELRAARIYRNQAFSVTPGMHFNYFLWQRIRHTMPAWRVFHIELLADLWPSLLLPHADAEDYYTRFFHVDMVRQHGIYAQADSQVMDTEHVE